MITITCDVDGCDESRTFQGCCDQAAMRACGWDIHADRFHLGPKHNAIMLEVLEKANAAANEVRAKVLASVGLSIKAAEDAAAADVARAAEPAKAEPKLPGQQ